MAMNLVTTALVLLALATGIVALAPRAKIPAEVLLILGSLILSLIPGLPTITLSPDIVFLVFLPPIIFGAAYFTSWRDFKANKRPISLLAIGLVLFTTVSVAFVLKWLIPGMPWAVGFILGAIVSPPDASAATAITRQLGVPRRLITIIEGESLVNDATALVAYKFAVAAIMTGSFSLGLAVGKFILVGAGGIIVGLVIGWTGTQINKHLKETVAQILLSFLTAFAAYLFAEELGVSGVISTVTAGLYYGRWVPAQASAQLRIEAKAGWDLILFIINAFVFTLIGFQLPVAFSHLHGYRTSHLVGYAAIVSLLVMVVRMVWVFPAAYVPRLLFRSVRESDPLPSWKNIFILSWTGMRGIVSLAAALSLPLFLPSGEAFPYRHLLIFLTYTTILTTLLLPSFTLPTLLRWLHIKSDNEAMREETLARVASVQAVLNGIEKMKTNGAYHPEHVNQLERRYLRRLETLQANLSNSAFSPLFDEDAQRRRLLRAVIHEERQALVGLRDDGKIHNDVMHLVMRELDLEELRLWTQRL